MIGWRRPVALVNARVHTDRGLAGSIRFDTRILGFDEPAGPHDVVVDVDGGFVLPGLINAHDHLELNHYGPLKRRERYENAIDWIDDLRPLVRDDPAIRAGTAHPLSARLFIGGLKNLLAGATTVAHHNPRYAEIDRHTPVRVVERYAWAHSFPMAEQPVGANGEPGGNVISRCLDTPADVPFIVHAAEGVDERARREFSRLQHAGCLRPNTVLVHGVALGEEEWRTAMARGTSLVWCPSSNLFLFGRTVPVGSLLEAVPEAASHICLGTDSRLTGAPDLLGELRAARKAASIDPEALLRMVTRSAASILRLPEAGRLSPGVPADLIVVPAAGPDPALALLAARRSTLGLVVIDGRPLVGSRLMAPVFTARGTRVQEAIVDDAPKLLARTIGRRIATSPIPEPGVQVTS